MKKTIKEYKILDLFAGIGGFSLGFKKFQIEKMKVFKIVAALEKDKNAVNTLIKALVKDGIPYEQAVSMIIQGDISLPETKKKLFDTCKDVDIIIGGPPCQSFSMIGPRSGDKTQQEKYTNDDRDNLFEHYLEIVEHYNPQMFVFENVKGILSKKNNDGIKYIDIIIDRFEQLGYRLQFNNDVKEKKYTVLNAVDFGVPQNRERVIIIGNKYRINNFSPIVTHCSLEKVPTTGLLPYVNLQDAIGDLPKIVPKLTYTLPNQKLDKKVKIDIPQQRKESIDVLNLSRNNGEDRTPYHWDNFNYHYKNGTISRRIFLDFIKPSENSELIGHKARSQQESDVILFENMAEGMTANDIVSSTNENLKKLAILIKYNMNSFKDKYKKLSWSKPSNTIIAHLQKDGNRYIHPDSQQGRTITVREAARIQSFPDDYEIDAIGNLRFKYIGNAVPPLLGLAVADAVYRTITSVNPKE
ncbi:DNA cytosine methyltransferase [Paenibacillus thiaminolyticus]|uniref:Cytosine-specific methyltransferase n=1 Tax=Paenibacillus thiaminolyticus TaxID=49283 RepID=A0A3A3GI85_PANTH|nr:DNA (cytosine-5-)-methyltransferase [Paenibacillus thiaminolyticus]RJG23745.1 DNA (cytosine-5-)-methyltransferase [Paenibacillus thiaminolyticus]